MRTNYILIDYENVQPACLSQLNGHPCKVIVFVGANQNKIPLALALALQLLGQNAQYVQASGGGVNALDFLIAYTLGELGKTEPEGYFHIISKDTGFDPLVDFMKRKGLHVMRSASLSAVPPLRLSNATSIPEKINAVVKNLTSCGSGRPRKVKTLSNTINAIFLKSLEQAELTAVIEALEKAGHISIEGESISYHLPSTPQQTDKPLQINRATQLM